MYAGCGRAGDFAGNPLLLGSESISWTSDAHSALLCHWSAPAGLPVGFAWIIYVDGTLMARNVLPPFWVIVPTLNVVPQIAAVAVSPALVASGTYDPIHGQDLANLIDLVELPSLNTGIYTGPVEALRGLLSTSATLQQLLQVSSAADALERLIAFGEADDTARPFVLVNFSDGNRQSSTKGHFLADGRLTIQIEVPFVWTGIVSADASLYHLTLGTFAGMPDDFFTTFILTVSEGAHAGAAATVLGFTGATGETVVDALPALLGVGTGVKMTVPSIMNAMNFFMRQVEDIQSELEDAVINGNLNIKSIRLGDYGRMNAERDDVYGGAKIEVDFGA